MAVVFCGDAAKVLETAEEAFDAIAGFINFLVIAPFLFSGLTRWDDGFCAALANEFPQIVAIVPFVGNDVSGFWRLGQTAFGGNVIADIPGTHLQNYRTAFIVCYGMYLGVFAAARRSYAAIRPPFLRPDPAIRCTLMCVESMAIVSVFPSSATREAKMCANTPFSLQRTYRL